MINTYQKRKILTDLEGFQQAFAIFQTQSKNSEPIEKTRKREGMIKASGHHSPFDHVNIMLELDQIPKIIAMYLNNEKMYTTSEKSARY